MRRVLDLRITHWAVKLAYIGVLWLVGFTLQALLMAMSVHPGAANIIGSIVLLAGIHLATRIFRGKGEPVTPARPWWQMTAWPKLSRRLGIYISISNVFSVVYVVVAIATVDWARGSDRTIVVELVMNLLFNVLIGVLYLNSAIRQTRAGVVRPTPAAAPAFKVAKNHS